MKTDRKESAALALAAGQWIDACREESWVAREQAVRALAAFDTDALFDFFVNVVRTTGDFASRNAALVWLERHASDRIYQLFELLREGESRLHLINLAGRICEPKSLPLLHPFLTDDDANVVQAAIETIGNIGYPGALPWLEPFLNGEDPWNAFPAITAVGAIGDASGVALIAPLVEDEFLAPVVFEALGRIGGHASVVLLLNQWDTDDPLILEGLVRAIGELWQREDPALAQVAAPHNHLSRIPVLVEWTESRSNLQLAKGALWFLCHLDPQVAGSRFRALIDQEDWLALAPSVARLVGEMLPLAELASAVAPSARLAALEMACATGRLKEVAPLLINDGEVGLRLELARRLQTHGTDRQFVEDYLVELIFDSSDEVRTLARAWFRKTGTGPLEAIGPSLFDRANADVIAELLSDFPDLGQDEILARMHRLIDREMLLRDPATAMNALRCLRQKEWVEQMRSLFLHFKEDSVLQLQLLGTLESKLEPVTRTWLKQVFALVQDEVKNRIACLLADDKLKDENFWLEVLRQEHNRDLVGMAVGVAGLQNSQAVWRQVRGLWVKADSLLRREILLALHQWQEGRAEDYLRALDDSHWSVRSTAAVLMPENLFSTERVKQLLSDSHINVRIEAAVRSAELWGNQLQEHLSEDHVREVRVLVDNARELAKWS